MSPYARTQPVTVPSSRGVALSRAQAMALADDWVSARNRLDPQTAGHVASMSFLDMVVRLTAMVRRHLERRWTREGYALSPEDEGRLRAVFDAELGKRDVREMHDAVQRKHLGEVIFDAAQRLHITHG